MKIKPIAGAIGYLCGARFELDGFDLPLVRASADQFKNVELTNAKSSWKDAASALRDITNPIDFLSSMKAKRERSEKELINEIVRAVLEYKTKNNPQSYFGETFCLCRGADSFDYGWVECIATCEKVCEWRWNDLKHDGSSATVSFEFKAFDNKTTEGN
ncbi:hypothetical protein AAS23_gp55 [Pantoea phage vB_PagS_AAS23]|uniref:Uncharacterized protein n=1 Tax=Pantoea phage vB_PagS_AAS23 TaxID=2499073 RepID=A0A3S9U7X0_9CAUD|nr:hypothetical protein HOU93_gp55 [Pantoea phage vB_PagS_AAS23]AZS06368.1 hypothetical protein AAS23_gp55 [Pantoea phage vB_PagS_AAS23]